VHIAAAAPPRFDRGIPVRVQTRRAISAMGFFGNITRGQENQEVLTNRPVNCLAQQGILMALVRRKTVRRCVADSQRRACFLNSPFIEKSAYGVCKFHLRRNLLWVGKQWVGCAGPHPSVEPADYRKTKTAESVTKSCQNNAN